MIKVAVFGVNGRMGRAIASEVVAAQDMQLSAAIVRDGNSMVGTIFPDTDLAITAKLGQEVDVIIDFTLPEGVMDHLQYAKPMVIGATGFTEQQVREIKGAAEYVPILFSANMSLGVNWCYKLLESTASSFDNTWDVHVRDVHHIHKKDQPSGTSKEIVKILSKHKVQIESERRGEVVGEHSVTFTNGLEEIIITHKAKDRNIYAKGAVEAARWIYHQEPRLYSMRDLVA